MAAPQTGLTSCKIGDTGHPRTVYGNPRHIPFHFKGWSAGVYTHGSVNQKFRPKCPGTQLLMLEITSRVVSVWGCV